jgi:hypothetical protein
MAVEGENERPAPDTLPWQELIEPAQRQALGYNVAGSAALAGAAALAAGSGWALCAPCGSSWEVIEMARANPEARFLCIDAQWERVLETRRLARHAELKNIYFARGDVTLLPVRGGTMSAAWSQAGLLAVAPERFTTQLARVTKPEAWVAGLAQLSGEQADYLAVLAASGLRDVRSFRDGAFVRWVGARA